MKNIQKSLCNVAVVLGLAAMSSQAFAAEEPSLFDGSAPAMTAPVPAPSVAPASSVPAPVASPAPEVAKATESKKEDLDESSQTQDNILRQVSVLQSKYMLKKVQKDIQDLDGKKDEGQANNQNMQNGSPMLGNQGFNNGSMMPSNLPPMPNSQPTTQAASVPVVVKEPEPVMTTTAIYSLGNQAYAEINVNGNKFVAKRGTKLPNGYTVSSLNDLGVTLTKGKRKVSLPVVAASSSAASESASTATPMASGAPSIMPIPSYR